MESRGGRYGSTIFFGLQYLLKQYLEGSVVSLCDVDEADAFWKAHGEPFAGEAWTNLALKHGGKLPIRIKACREGQNIPTHNVLLTVESTDPEFFWLPSYLETQIVRAIWYATTVATQSHYIKRTIKQYLDETANDTKSELPFKLHDFGARGVSSSESAGIGGMAHLVNFMGSDTVEGIRFAQHYYGVDGGMPAFSIPACYDDSTEILTERGFRLFSELSPVDRVAQYNPNGTIEFQIPSKYHSGKSDGKMIRFLSRGDKQAKVDLLVTSNHRMIRRSVSTGDIEIQSASDATFSQRNSWIQAGTKNGTVCDLSAIDRLRIAFQADGSFPSRADKYTGSRSGTKPIRFTLKKDRKKERLVSILEQLGWEYNVSDAPEDSDRSGYSQYWICVPKDIAFKKTLEWVNLADVNSDWCKQFIDEVSNWDGTNKGNSVLFSTTIRENADVFQAVSVLAGYRSQVSVYEDERENRLPVFTASACKTENSRNGQGIEKSTENYDGNVYCVTVPSGMVIVRRNGVVSISGNS